MCPSNAIAVIRALDRLETVATSLHAVSDLLTPEPDFKNTSRDRVAVLMDFLVREHEAAQAELRAALKGGVPC